MNRFIRIDELVWNKLRHIWETHQPAPLPPEMIERIEIILREAEILQQKRVS